mmetsp:Transcript_70798/g.163686  ORF Transcript_70798/g.163686 Transcript_70798/m.163686 type:complete len:127 (+) Transcript_70798:646-1026(+)
MPPAATSSSCVPRSMTPPLCTTAICLALITVERRCAMRTTVHFTSSIKASSACCTRASFSASKAEVASSRKSSRGRRKKHRAMARRCRWPPDNSMPRSPTRVSYCSSVSMMNSCAFAALHAATTSS